MIKSPVFILSLDFELFWGVHDKKTIAQYGSNIIGARTAIIEMLQLFEQYDLHVTWATVGLLFYNNKITLQSDLPEKLPSYTQKIFSPYPLIKEIGSDESSDPYHLALSLIKKIQTIPFQEIGTHTYSHYYCLEEGQTIEEFNADIAKAVEVAKQHGIELKSIVFPRNQLNENYLKIIEDHKIKAYRGNEHSWLYTAVLYNKENIVRRLFRLLDSYINISGHHVYDLTKINTNKKLVNIPSSRFLRPYSPALKALEALKLNRIKKDMLAAAKENKAFHLWWHPHNFGTNTTENVLSLKTILEYYLLLKKEYGMMSFNMGELADKINE